MGRAGRSSGGHSSSRSSSHSSGRSSGGHRSSHSSSRSSSGSSSHRSSSFTRKPSSNMTYDPYRNYGSGYRRSYSRNPFESGTGSSFLSGLFRSRGTEYYNYDEGYDESYQDYSRPKGSAIGRILLILIPFICFIGIIGTFGFLFKNIGLKEQFTQNISHYDKYEGQVKTKDKIEGYYYIYDCIRDELGWFENESETEQKLKAFFDETGVQPCILLKDYDSSLLTDDEKLYWAEDYFDEEHLNENTFLFVYFAEEDTDNDVGYMVYVAGSEANELLGQEEIDNFWDDVDYYWYQDIDTDDVFVNLFNDTVKNIMYE